MLRHCKIDMDLIILFVKIALPLNSSGLSAVCNYLYLITGTLYRDISQRSIEICEISQYKEREK